MKAVTIFGLLLVFIFVFSSCLAGPNDMEKVPDSKGKVAGFWKGLWHGFISPITFIISIFTKSVRFYEIYNSGFWYNLGFVLGAGILLHGGFFGARAKKKKDQISAVDYIVKPVGYKEAVSKIKEVIG